MRRDTLIAIHRTLHGPQLMVLLGTIGFLFRSSHAVG